MLAEKDPAGHDVQLVLSAADWCHPEGHTGQAASAEVWPATPNLPAVTGHCVQLALFPELWCFPAGHTAHVCVLAEKDPAGHDVQLVLSAADWCHPEGHTGQAVPLEVWPATPNLPASHVTDVHVVSWLLLLKKPGAQAMQEVRGGLSLELTTEPAAHEMHAALVPVADA